MAVNSKMDEMTQARLIEAVEHWNAERDNYHVKCGYRIRDRLEIIWKGSRYIKIAVSEGGVDRSVYLFVDLNGDIYKAASWKAPAKHKRGSIFDEAYGWGKAVGPYGAAYLR